MPLASTTSPAPRIPGVRDPGDLSPAAKWVLSRTLVDYPYWSLVALSTAIVALRWRWVALAVPVAGMVLYYGSPVWHWSRSWTLLSRTRRSWHAMIAHCLPVGRRGHLPAVRSVEPFEYGLRLVVSLPAGIVPDDLERRSEHLAHGLSTGRRHVHAVRVMPHERRGRCWVVVLERDPLAQPVAVQDPPSHELGTLETGDPLVWDVAISPHLLVIGDTGSGKSSLLRRLAISQPWDVILLDPKVSEFGTFPVGGRIVGAASDLDQIAAALEWTVEVMQHRQTELARHGLTHFSELEGCQPVLVLFDEVASALGDTSKAARQPVSQAQAALQKLVLRGRSAGIAVCIGAQRGDTWLLGPGGGLLRDNLRARIALGSLSTDGAAMAFEDASVRHLLGGPPGTGVAWRVGPGTEQPVRIRTHWISREECQLRLELGE